MNSEERMLHDIGIADFVLTDLMLYLTLTPQSRMPWSISTIIPGSRHRWSGNSPENITPCGKIWQKVTRSGVGATLPYPGKEDVTDVEL